MYDFARLYHGDDDFSKRWQAVDVVDNGLIFVCKDKYVFLVDMFLEIPQYPQEVFFFNAQYVIVRDNQNHVWLGIDENA